MIQRRKRRKRRSQKNLNKSNSKQNKINGSNIKHRGTMQIILQNCVFFLHNDLQPKVDRSVAQLVEHRSPKPGAVGSSPSTPAKLDLRNNW